MPLYASLIPYGLQDVWVLVERLLEGRHRVHDRGRVVFIEILHLEQEYGSQGYIFIPATSGEDTDPLIFGLPDPVLFSSDPTCNNVYYRIIFILNKI